MCFCDHKREDFAETGHRCDAIIDIGGNSSLSRRRRALTPKGTFVITGGETDGRWLGGVDRQLRAMMLSPFLGQKLGTFVASVKAEDLIVLKELIEAGKVIPAIDRTFPLSEAPKAIHYLEEGHARGKVAIAVEDIDGGEQNERTAVTVRKSFARAAARGQDSLCTSPATRCSSKTAASAGDSSAPAEAGRITPLVPADCGAGRKPGCAR